MKSQVGQRVVVMGGSLGGTLAARVLSESYDEVVVVDRDTVLGVFEPRQGAPHTVHAHALHARGHQVLEELFPGLTDELVEAGVPTCDYGEMHWYLNGLRAQSSRTGLLSVMAPRPKLEGHIRERVAALPNVTYLERHDIRGIVATPGGERIIGVRVEPRDGDAGETVLEADLVVDSTGKGSRTPAWLEELGYDRPDEERVKIGLAYTTRHYEMYPGMMDGIPSIASVPSPSHPRGAFFGSIGPNLCNLSLTGMLGDHAPTDPEGFVEFVKTLPVPKVYAEMAEAKPLFDPVKFTYPHSVRRRYERLNRFPERLLVVGDAFCSFNPVYGQGMTVAALEALALREHLSRGVPEPAAAFFADASQIIDTPWEISAGGDLAWPGVEGRRTTKIQVGNAYLGRLQHAALKDPKVTEGFMRVVGLLDPPDALMRPKMMFRVLRQGFGKPPAASIPQPVPVHIPPRSTDAGLRPSA
jgi:2-polyprenyl-6-methoxyphenol hydroxylase-like FAD-dependent oxidoreductase